MKSFVVRLLVSTVAVTAVLLLVMLALASANTEFFDRYYGWLYAANVAVAMVFMLIVISLIVIIIARVRQGRFGTRLLAKLAFIFALVGVVPGAIIYIVSYQFVSRSIESWFDVNVETALTSGLTLGRGMLENSLADYKNRARQMSDQLASSDTSSLTLALLRMTPWCSSVRAINTTAKISTRTTECSARRVCGPSRRRRAITTRCCRPTSRPIQC
jgi:nitrogen fixation/metabolism regulation signal transduction histidine kinase